MAHVETQEEKIARVCHEANRAYCLTIGDFSQSSWDVAPVWQKESAVAGVKAAIADPERTPAKSHAEWMAHRIKAGWKCGPAKRPEILEHPCLVEWESLPLEQRVKDSLFLAVVRALSPAPTVDVKPAASATGEAEPTKEQVSIATEPGSVSEPVLESKWKKRRRE